MSELLNDLGAVGIGVELDLSGLEGQLRELEQFQLPALKLKVQIDPKSLQAQLQSLKLEPIAVDIKVNAGKSEESLARLTDKCAKAQQQLQSLAEELRSLSGTQVNFNVKTNVDRLALDAVVKDAKSRQTKTVTVKTEVQTSKIPDIQPKVTAQVDDRQLTALNKHLDLKKRHFQEVQSFMNSNKLTPHADWSELLTAQKEIANFRRLVSRSNGTVRVRGYADIEGIQAGFERAGEKISKSIERSVKKGFQKDFFGEILGGIGTGFLNNLGQSFGFQFQRSLKKNFSLDLGKTVGQAFDAVAVPVKTFIVDNEHLKSVAEEFGDLLGEYVKRAGYRIGDGIVAALEDLPEVKEIKLNPDGTIANPEPKRNPDGSLIPPEPEPGSLVSRFNSFLRVAFDPQAFEQGVENFTQEVQGIAEKIPQAFFNPKALKPLTDGIQEGIANYRELTLRERAIPLIHERATEILAQKRVRNSAKIVDENTDQLFIATGGYAGARGLSGARIAQDLNKTLPEGSKAIWVKNEDTDLPKEAMGEAATKLQALVTSLAKPNLRGYSRDALEMASQALAAIDRNPEIKIRFIGESGGGFAAEEAQKIMELLGFKNSEYIGVGTPDFLGRLTTQGKIISPDEILGAESHSFYSKFGLSSVDHPSQNILGVTEHPYENYRDAKVAEYQNFVYGPPAPLSKEELSQIKEIALPEFQALTQSSGDSRELAQLNKLAFDNLQLMRRHLLVATDETKAELEEIVASFEQIFVKTADSPKAMQSARSALHQAAEIYQRLEAERGVEAGKIAQQLVKELTQIQKELKSLYGNSVGTIGKQYRSLYADLSQQIEQLKNPALSIKTDSTLIKSSRAELDDFNAKLPDVSNTQNSDAVQEEIRTVVEMLIPKQQTLDEIAAKRTGETAEKYKALAAEYAQLIEKLQAIGKGLSIKDLTELKDAWESASVSDQIVEEFVQSQLAVFSQFKSSKFVEDPWESRSANLLNRAKHETGQVVEEVGSKVASVFRRVVKAAGDKAEETALVMVNQLLATDPSDPNTIIVNPRQVRKLSELTAEDYGHLARHGVDATALGIKKVVNSQPVQELGGATIEVVGRVVREVTQRIQSGGLELLSGLLSGAKAAYELAAVTEQTTFKMLPLAKEGKWALQNLVFPSLAFGAATHALPMAGAAGEALHGAISYAVNTPGAFAADYMSAGLSGTMSHAFDAIPYVGPKIGHGAAEAVTTIVHQIFSMIGGAVTEATTPIVGGKLLLSPGTIAAEQLGVGIDQLRESRQQIQQLKGQIKQAKILGPASPQAANDYLTLKVQEVASEVKAILEEQIQALPPSARSQTPEGQRLAQLKGQVSRVEKQAERLKSAAPEVEFMPSAAVFNPTVDEQRRASAAIRLQGDRFRDKAKALGKVPEADNRIANEIIAEAEAARRALDELMSAIGGNATKQLRDAVKTVRGQITKAERKAKGFVRESDVIQPEVVQPDDHSTPLPQLSLKPATDGMKGAGENVAQGLAIGIEQESVLAEQAAQEMAQGVIDVTKSTLDIHSPSRVFIKIGQEIVAGFRIGIEKLKSVHLPIPATLHPTVEVWKAGVKSRVATVSNPETWRQGGAVALAKAQAWKESLSALKDQGVEQIKNVKIPNPQLPSFKIPLPKIPLPQGDFWLQGLKGGFDTLLAVKKQVEDFFRGIVKAIDSVIPGFSKFLGAIQGIIAGFVGFRAVMLVERFVSQLSIQSIQAAINIERLKTAMTFASGNPWAAVNNLSFVQKTVDELRIPLAASQEGFIKLAAATRNTKVEGQATKDLFLGLSEASTVLGLSADEMKGSLLALSQVNSKGVASSEELRQQLAERIPSAMSIAARSMHLTDAAFNKLLQSGQVLSQDFLPKFGKQLQLEFGEQAKNASGTVQSAIFNVQNQFLKLQQMLGQESSPVFKLALNAVASVLSVIAEHGMQLLEVITALSYSFAIQFVASLTKFVSVVNMAELAILGLRGAYEVVSNAIRTVGKQLLLAGLGVAVIELYRGIGDAINTELTKNFNQAAEAAQRAAEAARKVKQPTADGHEPPPEQQDLPDTNWVDMLSRKYVNLERDGGLAGGVGKSVLSLTPVGAPAMIGETVNRGVTFLKTGKADYYSYADLQRDTTIDDVSKVTGAYNDMLSSARIRLSQFKVGIGDLAPFKAVDGQLQQAESERRILQGQAERDYTRKGLTVPAELQGRIEGTDARIKQLSDQRDNLAQPMTDDLNRVTQAISSTKGQIEALQDPQNIAKLGGEATAREQRSKLQESLKALQQYKREAEETLATLKIDPILQMAKGFEDLTLSVEAARREVEKWAANERQGIATRQLEGTKTNVNASRDAALETAIVERSSTQQEITATELRLQQQGEILERPEVQAKLAEYGINPGSSIQALSKELNATPQDEANKAKRQTLEQLKNLRELQEKLPQLRATLAGQDLKINEQVQTNALADFERQNAKNESTTRLASNQRGINLAIEQKSLPGERAQLTTRKAKNEFFSETDAAIAESKLAVKESDLGINQAQHELTSLSRNLNDGEDQLARLKALQAEGKIGAEEFEKRERELTNQISDLKLRKAQQENALAEARARKEEALARQIEATNRKVLESIELANRKAQSVIQLSQTHANTAIKLGLLAGTTTREDAAIAETGVNERATRQKAALLRQELTQLTQLEKDHRLSGKEALEKRLQLTQELAEANSQLADLQLQKQQQLRERAIKDIEDIISAEERKGRLEIANLDAVKTRMIEIAQKALELQERLIQAKGELQKSLDQLATTRLEIKVKESDEALKLKELLKDPKAGSETKRVARKQLQALGFSGSDSLSQLNDQKLEREQALARQKQAALLREEALQQRLLEFEIKKQEFAAKANQLEARKNLLLQQQAMTQAKLKLEKAEAMEPGRERDRAIAEAQAELKLATEGFGLAKDQLQMADSQAAAQGEYSQAQRDKMTADQQNERVTFQEGQRERLRGAEVESAQLADKTHRRSQFDFEGAMSEFNRMPVPLPIGMDMSLNRPVQPGAFQTAPSLNPIQSIQQFQPSNARASGFMETLVTMLSQKLDQLNANIERLANTPRSIAFHSQQPVEDYADYQNRQATNLMRAWS